MYGAKGLTKRRDNKVYKFGPYRMLESQLVALGIKPEILKMLPEDTNPWAKPSEGIDLEMIKREMQLALRQKELEKLSKKPEAGDTKMDDPNRS